MTDKISCPKCGVTANSGKKFCWSCGGRIDRTDAATLPVEPSIPQTGQVTASGIFEIQQAQSGSANLRECPTSKQRYDAAIRFCKADGTPLSQVGDEQLAAVAAARQSEPEPAVTAPTSQCVEDKSEDDSPDLPAPPDIDPHSAPQVPVQPDHPVAALVDNQVEPLAPESRHGDDRSNETVWCTACGNGYPTGTRFCDQDGTPLSLASGTFAADTWNGGMRQDWAEDEASDGRPDRRNLKVAYFGIGAIILAGAIYWSGVLGKNSDVNTTGRAETPTVPGLLGTYTTQLADQDITLTVSGDVPAPLTSVSAVVEYHNRVNGGSCTAALLVSEARGAGGESGNEVRFGQQPIPGKQACPQSIPVTGEIAGEPINGVLPAVRLTWTDPSNGNVLMSGLLERDGTR